MPKRETKPRVWNSQTRKKRNYRAWVGVHWGGEEKKRQNVVRNGILLGHKLLNDVQYT